MDRSMQTALFFFFMLMLFWSGPAHGLSGIVVNASGAAVAMASVALKSTGELTLTNVQGAFSFAVTSNHGDLRPTRIQNGGRLLRIQGRFMVLGVDAPQTRAEIRLFTAEGTVIPFSFDRILGSGEHLIALPSVAAGTIVARVSLGKHSDAFPLCIGKYQGGSGGGSQVGQLQTAQLTKRLTAGDTITTSRHGYFPQWQPATDMAATGIVITLIA